MNFKTKNDDNMKNDEMIVSLDRTEEVGMKRIISLLLAVLLAICTGCSESAMGSAGKELGDTMANAANSDNEYVLFVKNGYREYDPDVTYDMAFSSFFASPRWTYFMGEDGEDVVEFTGDCVYLDVDVKASIQFLVDEENGSFEACYLSFNKVPQNMLILAALIERAFETVYEDAQ